MCVFDYLKAKLEVSVDGSEATCMQAGCNMKYLHSHYEFILSENPKVKELYWKQFCKSFTDNNRAIKWCPEPGCEYCIENVCDARLFDVTCFCGTSFCFNCEKISHQPCNCEMYQQWVEKACAESENVKWIMANTKKCPACRKAIEKNQGCNHMKCVACNHEFCWVCLGDWKEHGTATGGYYKCNKYEEKITKNKEFS